MSIKEIILKKYVYINFKKIQRYADGTVINSILATSNDYMSDLVHLRPEGQVFVLIKWHNRIKVEYMKAFMTK